MSIGGLIVGLILIGVVLLLVVAPLLLRSAVSTSDDQRDRLAERLRLYYERALRNIRDLDEDHALGKLDDTDYAADRAYWTERGVQALKALDTVDTLKAGGPAPADAVTVTASAPDDAAIDAAIDDAIEAAVRAARTREASTTT